MILFVSLLVGALVVIYVTFKERFAYWKRKDIPYMEPSIPFGNAESFWNIKTHRGFNYKRFYDYFKSIGAQHGGIYSMLTPTYIPMETELIKNILTRDFEYFTDKHFYMCEPISHHLFNIGGERWKALRHKISPSFSSGKMKLMVSHLLECRKPLVRLLKRLDAEGSPLDIKETAARFTIDVVGSVAFGLDCNSIENPDSEFRKNGKDVFSTDVFRVMKTMFSITFGDLSRFLGLTVFPKHTAEFYYKIVTETIAYRRQNNVRRNDFLQLMIDMQDRGPDTITMDEIVAQSLVFFLAGFDTSSTTVSFCMFELAKQPELQDKLRKEIVDVFKKHHDEITYESLNDLVYMRQVIDGK